MEITIPVRLTEEDVVTSASEYYDTNGFTKRKILRISYIIIMLFIIFSSFCMILSVIFFIVFAGGLSIRTFISLVSLLILNSVIFIILALLPKIDKKNNIKTRLNNFRKDYFAKLLHTYVFSAKGITDKSKTENRILHWDEIYHLTEYVSCFVIQKSSSKSKVIPRRCFENAQQLRDFRSIVSSNMPAAKWTLKGIPLGLSKPDAKTDNSTDDAAPIPDQKDSLYTITYQIEERESVLLSFSILRHSTIFMIQVIVFVFLFGSTILSSLDNPPLLGTTTLLLFSIQFWNFFICRKIFLESIRTDKTFGREETATFFPDRLVINAKNGHSEYFWNTIIKIRIPHSGLLIYTNPGYMVIFPARVINSIPNKDEFKAFLKSRELAKSNRSRISK